MSTIGVFENKSLFIMIGTGKIEDLRTAMNICELLHSQRGMLPKGVSVYENEANVEIVEGVRVYGKSPEQINQRLDTIMQESAKASNVRS